MAIRLSASEKEPSSAFMLRGENILDFLKSKDAEEHFYRHQITSVLAAKELLENPLKPNVALVVLPTGCGKSGVAVLAAYALKPRRVLVITPSVKISDQIYSDFCSRKMKSFLACRGIFTPDDEEHFLPIGGLIRRSTEIEEKLQCHLMVLNPHKVGKMSSVPINEIPRDRYNLVIVDEAHHYPAKTWKLLVDHFSEDTKRLFLTATPTHSGTSICPFIYRIRDHRYPNFEPGPCFSLSRSDAVERGIIRPLYFHELKKKDTMSIDDMVVYKAIATKVEEYLDHHDEQDPGVRHQAMVLAQTKDFLNAASDFCQAYSEITRDSMHSKCHVFTADTKQTILTKFIAGEIRTLVVVGRLLEGFDHKSVSVVAIVRNVATKSQVLFAQFVGRALRKVNRDDPVCAVIISHEKYKQKANYDHFDNEIAEVDPEDED